MPLFHCGKCHHEWEGSNKERTCAWCGDTKAYVLSDRTPLQVMLEGRERYEKKKR